jgi:hypothetical protein
MHQVISRDDLEEANFDEEAKRTPERKRFKDELQEYQCSTAI